MCLFCNSTWHLNKLNSIKAGDKYRYKGASKGCPVSNILTHLPTQRALLELCADAHQHTISIASRLNLCSFDQIAMNLPLEPKKRRGRRPKRSAPLNRDDRIEKNSFDSFKPEKKIENLPPFF